MNFINKHIISNFEFLDLVIILSYIFLIFPYLIFFLNKICVNFNILDFPDSRKNHKFATPLSGGLALTISLVSIYTFLYFIKIENINFFFDILFYSIVFCIFGIIDDVKSPNTKIKIFVIIFLILLILILSNELTISILNFKYISEKSFILGAFSIPFTLFCIFMFFNALNYTDGKNGISISYSLFILIYLLSLKQDNSIILFFILCLFILLLFNLKSKLFLGNSGVNFISIFLSLLIIKIYNSDPKLDFYCDEIFLLMLIPGVDAARVTIYRIHKKMSPFLPDHQHFHHHLEEYISNKYIWFFYLIISILPILILKLSDNFFISTIVPISIYVVLLNKFFKKKLHS